MGCHLIRVEFISTDEKKRKRKVGYIARTRCNILRLGIVCFLILATLSFHICHSENEKQKDNAKVFFDASLQREMRRSGCWRSAFMAEGLRKEKEQKAKKAKDQRAK